MSVVSRARVGVTAAALVASAALVTVPGVASAADPQVCVTGKVPTADTQPWYKFAHRKNPMWAARAAFVSMVADLEDAARTLGPTSTQAEVDSVDQQVLDRAIGWQAELGASTTGAILTAIYELDGGLKLADPDYDSADVLALSDASSTDVQPSLGTFVQDAGSYLTALRSSIKATYPLTGPVAIPSSAAALTSSTTAAQAFDAWYALGTPHIVWSGTPGKTCRTTATLIVPTARTTFGKGMSLTITSTRDGLAARGDYAVLLDGRQIGFATQQSSYVATLPTTLRAGSHVLTVAFAPVDGSPLATRSTTVTVAKARTVSTLRLSKTKVTRGKKVRATVSVAVPGLTVKATGKAIVKVGKKSFPVKIRDGKGSIRLRKLRPGRHKVTATYVGATSLATSRTKKVRLVVTRR
jgi:hypothetical protein